MQITINQQEIEQAITEFVGKQFVIAEGKTIEVAFTAGRGPSGAYATIDIVNAMDNGATLTSLPTPIKETATEEDPPFEQEENVLEEGSVKEESLFGN